MTANTLTTITIVDSAHNDRRNKARDSCCFCVPEKVGVIAILSMYFFLGIFTSSYYFMGLTFNDGDDAVTFKILFGISGGFYALLATACAIGVAAIKKGNIVMMRRQSIAFGILLAIIFVLSVVLFSLKVALKVYLKYCQASAVELFGDQADALVDYNQCVAENVATESIRLIFTGIFMMYFAYVVFRFAKNMQKEELPFTAPSIDGQKTPTYPIYSAQPPTSNNWVPPPTYSVIARSYPQELSPDSKTNP